MKVVWTSQAICQSIAARACIEKTPAQIEGSF